MSHDERLLKMVCQELWVCSKGKVYVFVYLYFGISVFFFKYIVFCIGIYSDLYVHYILLQVWSIDGGLEEYRKMVEKEMILS